MHVGIVSVVRDKILNLKNELKLSNIKSGEVACPLAPLVCGEAGLCQGTLVHSENAGTTQDCDDACANFNGCNFYSFDPTLAECLMFETCPSVDDTFCPECVSGSPRCGIIGKFH